MLLITELIIFIGYCSVTQYQVFAHILLYELLTPNGCFQMHWYGREIGESALPPQMPSHDHVYTTTVTQILLTAFSRWGCCLRN